MSKKFLFFPLFFPKMIQKFISSQDQPSYYDECGVDITDQVVGSNSLHPHALKVSDPQPDFNSPTSATVNPISNDYDPLDEIFVDSNKSALNPQSMDLVRTKSYCLHCKTHVEVVSPEYYDQESRRGVRRYLKGTCSVCGSKINAIVKRGG